MFKGFPSLTKDDPIKINQSNVKHTNKKHLLQPSLADPSTLSRNLNILNIDACHTD